MKVSRLNRKPYFFCYVKKHFHSCNKGDIIKNNIIEHLHAAFSFLEHS